MYTILKNDDFLIGYENGVEKVYIGQAKKRNNGGSVLERLREHDKSITEGYNDIWSWAVVVTSREDEFSLDDLNALENAFYKELPKQSILNGNTPNCGGVDSSRYTDKINQIKSYITSIGFQVFDDENESENIQITSTTNEYSVVEDLHNGMARIPEIVTPHKVVKQMVDMLPKDVWNDKTVFLDPACKGGEYLREIYDRLMNTESMQAKYPNEIERSIHILQNQIFGIALSRVSLERTTKKLLGYGQNIRVIPNYIGLLKAKVVGGDDSDKVEYIRDTLDREFGREMRFDVVIGNPPYQENYQDEHSKPLYNLFMQAFLDISDIQIMITPNTYFCGKRFRDLRVNLIKHGIRTIVNYPISGEVFRGMGTNCCITECGIGRDETSVIEVENGERKDLGKFKFNSELPILLDSNEISILNKMNKNSIDCSQLIKTVGYFGIHTNLRIVSGLNKGEFLSLRDVKDKEHSVGVLYKVSESSQV